MHITFHTLFSAPILFFFLGILAVMLRSDLQIPQPISKFLALYLLFAIGYRGGQELAHVSWNQEVWLTLGIGMLMAILTPLYIFLFLKRKLSTIDAGAVAATYGSISAVSFITASTYLDDLGVIYGSHMLTLMALMETPAILMGILLIRRYTPAKDKPSYQFVLHEALTNSAVFMLVGSLFVGWITSPQEAQTLAPFTVNIFKGMLLFFLLDMGLAVGKNLQELKTNKAYVCLLGLLIPLINATIGISLCYYFQLNIGNSLLLVVLLASGSYIAVPATLRLAVPQANPSLYLSAALAITFPFNIVIGIPLYYYILQLLMG